MIREDGLAQLLYDFFFFVFFCWEKELNLGQGWHKELKLKIRFSQVFFMKCNDDYDQFDFITSS